MLTVHRSPVEAYSDAYLWTLRRVPPARWLCGALFMPATDTRRALAELQAAAWQAR
jgi:hypothetical protein